MPGADVRQGRHGPDQTLTRRRSVSPRYFEPYDDGEGHIVGGVRDVFDTVVAALDANADRKFIVVRSPALSSPLHRRTRPRGRPNQGS